MNDETQHIMHAHVHNNHTKLHVVDDGGQQPFPVRKAYHKQQFAIKYYKEMQLCKHFS